MFHLQAMRDAVRTSNSERGPTKTNTGQVTAAPKTGRNQLCPCGAGKKYKVCHGRPGA